MKLLFKNKFLILLSLLWLIVQGNVYAQVTGPIPDTSDDNNIYYEIDIDGPTADLGVTLIQTSDGAIQYNGASTGKLQIKPTGGTANYRYFLYKDNASSALRSGTISAGGSVNEGGLSSGTYRVDIYDAKYTGSTTASAFDTNNCNSKRSGNVTLSNPPLLQINASISSIIKCNGETGTIKANIRGGVNPNSGNYTVELFKNGSSTPTATKSLGFHTSTYQEVFFSGLSVGNYSIKVRDKFISKTASQNLPQPAALNLPVGNISTTSVTCYGDNNGTITVTPTGGTSPYKVFLNGSEISGTFTTSKTISGRTAANNYTLQIEDKNGCKTSIETGVTVGGPANPIAISQIDHRNTRSANGSDGFVEFRVTGGTPSYSYTFKGTAKTGVNLSGTITSSGGTFKFENLKDDTYTFTVIDNTTVCTENTTAKIEDPAPLVIGLNKTDVNCYGGTDGVLTGSAEGGASSIYRYEWFKKNGVTFNLISTITTPNTPQINVSAGDYKLRVSVLLSGNPVENTERTITVNQPSLPLKITEVVTNISCKGGNNGQIAINVTGGTAPYTYKWKNSSGTEIATTQNLTTNVIAGNYTVTVKDSKNCILEKSIHVAEPTKDLTVERDSVQNATANTADIDALGLTPDGSITVKVTGGTSPYSYKWFNSSGTNLGVNNATISNLKGGDYTVEVTDAKGCKEEFDQKIDEPTVLTINVEIPSDGILFCNNDSDGKINATVSGGISGYRYHWFEVLSDNSKSFLAGKTNLTVQGLSAGKYGIEVKDRNGSGITKYSSIVTLVNPPKVIIDDAKTSVTNIKCRGAQTGAISLDVSGGTGAFKFAWFKTSNPTNPIANTTVPRLENQFAGEYLVKITDDNNCPNPAIERTITITEPAADLTITSGSSKDAKTFGVSNGEVSVTVSGGTTPYRYELREKGTSAILSTSNPATGLAGSVSGIVYEMTVIDANGCSTKAEYTVKQPTALTLSLSVTSAIACYNGQGTIGSTVSGGFLSGGASYTYQWYNVTDLTKVIGTGTSLTTGFGTYRLRVTDSNGNVKEADETLVNPSEVVVDDAKTSVTNINCRGEQTGAIALDVSGGTGAYKFAWFRTSNPTNPIANTTVPRLENQFAGEYLVKITDDNNCPNPAIERTITITEPAADLTITSGSSKDAKTFGVSNGEVSVTVSGGTTPYRYELREKGTSAILSTSNPATGLAGSVSGIVYEMTVIDANGCSTKAEYTVKQPTALTLSLSVTSAIACYNGQGTIGSTVSGGFLSGGASYTYQWYNVTDLTKVIGTGTSLTTGFGTYRLRVTDSNGNVKEADETLVNPSEVVVDDAKTSVTNINCRGEQTGAIALDVSGGTGAYKFAWFRTSNPTNPVANTTVPRLENQFAGEYLVKITDDNNCPNPAIERTITITEPAVDLTITSGSSKDAKTFGVSNGEVSVTVSGGTTPYRYELREKGTSAILSTSNPATGLAGSVSGIVYEMTVIDANGCSTKAEYTVKQPTALTLSLSITSAIACYNGQGTIGSTVSGGFLSGGASYTYQWYNVSDLTKVVGTGTSLTTGFGTYRLRVTDSNGNIKEADETLVNPLEVVVDDAKTSITHVGCRGEQTGAISLDVSGGTGSYKFAWFKTSNPTNPIANTTVPRLENQFAGEYLVKITDDNNCPNPAIERTITITEPAADLTITSGSSKDAKTFGVSNGEVSVTVSGGTTPYRYELREKGTTAILSTSNPATGLAGSVSGIVYEMTVIDANGCSTKAEYTVKQPTALTLSLSVTSTIACYNGQGTIGSTVSGGFLSGGASYTYQWYNVSDLTKVVGTATSLTTGFGTYRLRVTDSNGNVKEADETLVNPSEVVVDDAKMSITHVGCRGEQTGAISLDVSGGTGSYKFAWFKTSNPTNPIANTTVPRLENQFAGEYLVKITDDNNCPNPAIERTIIITEPAADLAITSGSSKDAKTFGVSNGEVSVTVSGGTTPYRYELREKGTSAILSTSNPATGLAGSVSGIVYEMTVIDANGCSTKAEYTVKQPTALTLSLSVTSTIACYNGQGTIGSTVSGGFLSGGASYTYQWYNVSDLTKVVGTGTSLTTGFGTYKLRVTDSNGNVKEANETLVNPSEVVVDDAKMSITHVGCRGEQTGAISLDVSGGTGFYKFAWFKTSNPTNPIANTTVPRLENQFAGEYLVKITDDNNCPNPAIERTITITEPAQYEIANVVYNQPTGAGKSDGSISLDVLGGTAPFVYKWTDSNGIEKSTTKTISGIPAGDYTFTVTDGNVCVLSDTFVLGEPKPLTISVKQTGVINCNGEATGTLELTSTGGVGGNNYTWTDATSGAVIGNSEIVGNLPAGSYQVKVVDANGNEATSSVYEITQPSLITATSSHTNLSCFESNDGKIAININGGVGNYSYRLRKDGNAYGAWITTVSNLAIDNLIIGKYDVQIKDGNDCLLKEGGVEKTFTFDITQPDVLNITGVVTNVSGFGLSNGAIDATVIGGTKAYTLQWKNESGTIVATTEDLSNVVSGVYILAVTDAQNCTLSKTFTITQPDLLTISVKQTDVINCNGEATGTLELTSTGGAGGNVYTWTNATNGAVIGNSEIIGNLPAGSYQVKVVDANGNEATSSVYEITQPTLITATSSHTNLSCFESNDGKIAININGGVGNYSYRLRKDSNAYGAWVTTTSSLVIDNLAIGKYDVQIKDGNDCLLKEGGVEKTFTFDVTQPDVLNITGIVTNVSGFGLSNGAIDATVIGGTKAYTLEWKNESGTIVATTEDLSNVVSGVYTLVVTDAQNCTLSKTFTITQPDLLTISVKQTDVINCNGEATGTLELTSTGGAGGNVYTWTNATSGAVIGNSEIVGNLPAGSYQVKVVDANGNEATSSVYEITQPTLITATSSHTNLSCFESNDGKIAININGGVGNYSYRLRKDSNAYGAWITTTSSLAIDNLTIGKYDVQIKDGNDCLLKEGGVEKTFTFDVTQPDVLNITGVVTNVSGFGLSNGAIDATVIGGTKAYALEWKNQSGTIVATTEDLSNVVSGVYTLVVTDAQNCTLSKTFTITQPDLLTISVKQTDVINCNGEATGTLELTSTGGAGGNVYTWTNATSGAVIGNSEIVGNLPAGSYQVKVVDANGNEATSSVYEITQPTLITATSSHTNLSCFENNDGKIAININGGVGNYSYRLRKDSNAYGAWITTTSSLVIDNLAIGKYDVQIKDGNDCLLKEGGVEKTFTFDITQPDVLNITGVVTNVSGFGLSNGAIDATVIGGTKAYTLEWKNQSGTIVATTEDLSNEVSGVYTLTVKDAQNCTLSKTFIITQPEALTVALVQNNIVLCKGFASASINSTVTGGVAPYTYEWYQSGTNTVISNRESLNNIGIGTYHVVITDANNNVTRSTDIIIKEPETLAVTLNGTSTTCGGNNDWSISANVTGGTAPYSFEWSSGETTQDLTNVSLGGYFVVVTDANGCQVTQNIVLENGSPLEVTVDVTNTVCYNECTGAIDLQVTGGIAPYNITWNTGATGNTITNACHGEYVATITDQKGCVIVKTVEIKNAEEFIFDLVPDEVTLCKGETIEYDVTMNGVTSYSWTSNNGFRSTRSIVELSEAGKYQLTVVTNDGCSVSREVEIFKSDVDIDAQLILSSQAFVGEDIAIINVSNPISSNVEWIIPSNVEVKQKTDEGLVLRFPAPGDYNISLVATEGNCKKTATKTVNVLKARDLSDVGDAETPFIKEFEVYSNPNKGKFKVAVELEKEAEISLRLFGLGASSVVKDKQFKGAKEYQVDYDMNVSVGIYVLLLETPKAKRIRKVIIE